MSCVDGLKDLRTDKPQSIESQPNPNIKKHKHRSAEGENYAPNVKIWLDFPKGRFEAFLILGPKLLPEQLKIMARELFFGLHRISGFWNLQKADVKHFWFLAQNYCQNGSKAGAGVILGSGPNIWFLNFPEGRFEEFLLPGPKLLPERLKNMACELFLALDRISGFWNLQKTILKHFWFLAQNYCQNGSKTWRANYF